MTRIYNVFTHYDATPVRVRANSPKAALAIGLSLRAKKAPQFRSLVTEMPGTEKGGFTYSDCRALETPYAVRSSDQRSATEN